ncbi:MAG TPA: nucleotidyltransferase family protein [Alphaproteobacteria bacterium]|nr:nucleotidyltransferase family protein [Alphaproteobacteria bacterium]
MLKIDTAMVLAAGLGTRLRPLTNDTPKPLLKLAGKTMLDHALDHAMRAHLRRAIVNVHYLPTQILDHLKRRVVPEILISDESDELLETGGGIKRALDLIHRDVFFTLNADVMWRDETALQRMIEFWNPDLMDSLLLLTPRKDAVGFNGAGDYYLRDSGKLEFRGARISAPLVYAGATLTKSADFQNHPENKFSQKRIWDLQEQRGRIYGITLDGPWYHCSTPADFAAVTQALQ